MSVRAKLFDQFREPRGPLGILAGRIMSKRSSNQVRSAWTVDLLDIQPDHRVLELGYGPGIGIEAVLAKFGERGSGRLVGLDHSATMRSMALRRVRHHGSPERLDLRVGDAQRLPDDLGEFDAIFSCNVWLFWREPINVFQQLHRHLAPGGQLAVTHLPRHGAASRATSLAAAATISDQLLEAGFTTPRTEILEIEPVPAVCVLVRAPGGST